ncbi:MAG: mandelate racemase [Gammaproteobacteria bacterium]|nr:mandelate racemase [Gammaproteobacteria bacterium]
MKITRVESIVVDLPNRYAYGYNGLQVPIGNYVILRIETDSGLVGLGEAPTLPDWGGEFSRYYGEDPTTAVHMIEKYLTPLLIGEDPTNISALLQKLDVPVMGHNSAKSAIDLALHDLAGKAMNVPVYKLLGGKFRDWIDICYSVGIAEPEIHAEEARLAAEDGIRSMQVKVGLSPELDIQSMAAIREAVGPDVEIYPDANQAYKTPKLAIRTINAMKEYGITAVEQPVEGRRAMAHVTRELDIMVWTDEGVWTPQDALEVIQQGCADAISLYYSKSGGLQRTMQVGLIAAAAGFPTNLNGALETGIGNAANLHIAAALHGEVRPSVIPVTTLEGREVCKVGGVFYRDDIITEPFTYQNGSLRVPEGPGLGVELDMDKVERYRVV